ncbi:MAG: hypothetical protein GWO07_15245 [Candidatus Dadabacteria bacterium]|nr:hypothetical protein [Candidatus Dadabacteria bacterium]NIS10068.1 hypothetical protein [Candidatus Dadabacteria bacterium]NIV42145.1 hypothetical protein [Candidatus Dadabacteria bacterium]NIX16454.1 hypothetical protein [Candidatus Dadabacteria bacterium]NIY23015.1 hypothetical protein [Candidatus Dadabacteria bacterium]
MYEIARLINHVIGGSENKKREIVEKLGFRNDLYKGYSRLRGLMQTGRCDAQIRQNLHEALGIDKRFVQEAFLKTDRKLEEQNKIHETQRDKMEEKRFRPYLWIQHEYDHIMSKSYTNSRHYKEIKVIELPDFISSLEWKEQLKIIRRYINMNQKNRADKRFGNIRNYIYFKDVDESYLFDTYGGLIRTESSQQQYLQYAVS